jgi:NAD(P)H-hydrate repair Nnr-like enzyme with NAD(P)H-hydrate dehydratase domain
MGPGIEPSPANVILLDELCSTWDGPLVIDATALHLLTGKQTTLLPRKNHSTILTHTQANLISYLDHPLVILSGLKNQQPTPKR